MPFSKALFLLLVTFSVTFGHTKASKIEKIDKKQLNIDFRDDRDNSNEEPTTTEYNKDALYMTEKNIQESNTWLPEHFDKEKEKSFVSDIRDNNLVSNDESFSASLLMDIRDMLYREKEEKNEIFQQRVEQQRLENMAQQTQASVNSMADDIERYREFTDDKVNLVLETFSTLKLLVVNQGNQLREAMEKLDQMEEKTNHLESQFRDVQRSVDEANVDKISGDQRPIAIVSDESVPAIITVDDKINNITRTVRALQNDVRNMQANVTELIAMSQVITIHEKPSNSPPIITQDQNCQCPIEGINESIAKLEKDRDSQKIIMDELARNLTFLQGLQYQVQVDSTFRSRLGEVEGSLKDLNTVKRDVTDVKETLSTLKEELDHKGGNPAVPRNVTVKQAVIAGMCVWPYTRSGDSCYSVHTNKRLNWMASRDYCRSIQGDLASPTSSEDFRHFIGTARLSRAYTYWIGASDIQDEGAWTWVDGAIVPENSTLWGQDCPSDNRSSNCMAFKPNNRYEIVATDEECRISRYFVCEQERLV